MGVIVDPRFTSNYICFRLVCVEEWCSILTQQYYLFVENVVIDPPNLSCSPIIRIELTLAIAVNSLLSLRRVYWNSLTVEDIHTTR